MGSEDSDPLDEGPGRPDHDVELTGQAEPPGELRPGSAAERELLLQYPGEKHFQAMVDLSAHDPTIVSDCARIVYVTLQDLAAVASLRARDFNGLDLFDVTSPEHQRSVVRAHLVVAEIQRRITARLDAAELIESAAQANVNRFAAHQRMGTQRLDPTAQPQTSPSYDERLREAEMSLRDAEQALAAAQAAQTPGAEDFEVNLAQIDVDLARTTRDGVIADQEAARLMRQLHTASENVDKTFEWAENHLLASMVHQRKTLATRRALRRAVRAARVAGYALIALAVGYLLGKVLTGQQEVYQVSAALVLWLIDDYVVSPRLERREVKKRLADLSDDLSTLLKVWLQLRLDQGYALEQASRRGLTVSPYVPMTSFESEPSSAS